MQTNQTTQDFVQINNKRFSIQQFLDLLELQQKYLSKQDSNDPEEEQEDDSFGLVEDQYNQKKEECLQSVLNKFNFEAVVKSYNEETAEHEVYRHIDDLMDAAYELMSELYDDWMRLDEQPEVIACSCSKGMLVCTINKEGQIRLSSSVMAVGDIDLSKD